MPIILWIAKRLGIPTWGVFVGIALAVVLVFGGWKVNSWRNDAQKLPELQKKIDAYVAEVERVNSISERLEQNLSAERKKNQRINERLKNEISQNSVYSECVLPAGGVLLYREAVKRTPSR